MKKLFFVVAAAILMTTSYHAKAVEVGTPAPDFTLSAHDGTTQSLSNFSGKTIVLEWTNKDCPFVRKHYDTGNMQNLQKYYTEKDVVWLSIISSAPGKQGHVTADEAVAVVQAQGAGPSYVLLDPTGEVGRLYGAKTTPHMFVIDSSGTLTYAGAIDSISSADKDDIVKADNYVRAALEATLAGEAVDVSYTQPYGCSVKYGG